MIGPKNGIGERPHRVTLQNPGPPVADGHGGFTQSYTDLTPAAMSARIAPATAADLERIGGGTVLSAATYVVALPYHPDVTTKTRILYNGRTFIVTGVSTPEERQQETIALVTEVVK
jgi:SPP1 family predicted phage head-tail adaptor